MGLIFCSISKRRVREMATNKYLMFLGCAIPYRVAAFEISARIVAGTNVSIAVLNDGANEQLQVTASGGSLTDEKIKIVLDIISFLLKNENPNNVKSLETIMEDIDKNTKHIVEDIF